MRVLGGGKDMCIYIGSIVGSSELWLGGRIVGCTMYIDLLTYVHVRTSPVRSSAASCTSCPPLHRPGTV